MKETEKKEHENQAIRFVRLLFTSLMYKKMTTVQYAWVLCHPSVCCVSAYEHCVYYSLYAIRLNIHLHNKYINYKSSIKSLCVCVCVCLSWNTLCKDQQIKRIVYISFRTWFEKNNNLLICIYGQHFMRMGKERTFCMSLVGARKKLHE